MKERDNNRPDNIQEHAKPFPIIKDVVLAGELPEFKRHVIL